jgi:predicted nucleotidyltransferase
MNGDVQKLLDEVIARLEPLSLSRVILFGSRARGVADSESDIDLLVVLNRDDMPETHAQKTQLDLSVLRLLRDIRKRRAMDVIVHTRPMHRSFLATKSAFALEIQQKGVTIYEAGHAPMA